MGYIRIYILDENGKKINSQPKIIREKIELVAAYGTVMYIWKYKNKGKKACIELVNREPEKFMIDVYTNLVKKYSPLPVEIVSVREEVKEIAR